MSNPPLTPHSAPSGLEDRLIYTTQKLILFWRNDRQEAFNWFTRKDPTLRLLLIKVLGHLAVEEDTTEGLRADCREMVIYFNANYPAS